MKVKFLPVDKEFEINENESVLELAKRTGVFIKSICGGLPSCSECRIKIVSGEHNIMPPGFKEKSLIGSSYFIDHSRLSCQVKCMGDIVVDVTEQIAKEHAQPASKKPRMPMRYNKREQARDAARAQGGADRGGTDKGGSDRVVAQSTVVAQPVESSAPTGGPIQSGGAQTPGVQIPRVQTPVTAIPSMEEAASVKTDVVRTDLVKSDSDSVKTGVDFPGAKKPDSDS